MLERYHRWSGALLATACLFQVSRAEAVLSMAGDIAFVGLASRDAETANNDIFSFVALVDIGAGESIFFTDEEQPTISGDNEGTLQWTATSIVSAGTVVEIFYDTLANSGAASTGTIGEPDSAFALATSGDSLLAYTGTVNAPTTYLTLLNYADVANANHFGDETAVGLTYDMDAIDHAADSAGFDVFEYSGPTNFSDAMAARLALNDPANWTTGDNASAAGLLPFDVAAGAGSITIPEPGGTVLVLLGLVAIASRRRR